MESNFFSFNFKNLLMRKKQKNMELIGFALIIIAIFLFILGSLLIFFSKRIKIESGGIILIGPFPIIFGNSYQAILIALIFLILFLLIYSSVSARIPVREG